MRLKDFAFRIAVTLLLECAGLTAVALIASAWWKLALYIGLHGAASGLVAITFPRLVPERYRERSSCTKRAALFALAVSFTVPILGAIGLVVTAHALHHPWEFEPEKLLRIDDTPLPSRSTLSCTRALHRPGSLMEILDHSRDSTKRMQAILITRRMREIDAVPILRHGLKDAEDEVRLIAFALLDQKEKILNDKIKGLVDELERIPEGSPTAELHERIAQNSWELAYTGLVQGTIMEHVLSTAREHAESAILERPRKPELHRLLARILLKLGEFEQAKTHLRYAERLGLSPNATLPYRAEIAFLERDFETLRLCLARMDAMTRGLAPLAPLVKYWKAKPAKQRARGRARSLRRRIAKERERENMI